MMKKIFSVFAVIMFFALAASAYAVTYKFTQLDYPGASTTTADDINGGNIVGSYYDGTHHGFIFDGANWTSLDYPGASATQLTGISGINIVGIYYGAPDGFIYNSTTWTPINHPTASWTSVNDIDGNNIVGCIFGSGFLYNGTTWTPLNYFPYTCATGISGNIIVGHYFSGGDHGFFYDGANWMSLDYPGATATYPNGIDGSNIVGSYIDSGGISHGFIYDGANWTTIDYPGAAGTSIHGIEGENIVGSFGGHGFLATPCYSCSTLSIQKSGSGSGTVTSNPAGINCGSDCSEPYTSGTIVTLAATPDAGSTFAGWSGDVDCSDGQVTTDADKTCIATFDILIPTPTTLTVCPTGCDYSTIQSAINAAVDGNTVLVFAGTYTENINFNGKAITVKGAKGAGQTIINGGGNGSVVTFTSGEGANSILDGFTITGGSAWDGGINI